MPSITAHPARRIGVCSWSLQAQSPAELARKIREVGVLHVQLALDPIRTGQWPEVGTINALRESEIEVISGMMGMEGEDYSTLESIATTGGVRQATTWPVNLAAAKANALLSARLGLKLVTFHAGFIPHHAGEERRVMIERLRTLADIFDDRGIRVALETGQESAQTLLGALEELNRPSVGVNFDPANMILYGMGNPVQALKALAPRVAQIHIKDAVPTTKPGTWGEEVCAGAGAVDWSAFFDTVAMQKLPVDLVIEREAGNNRVSDAAAARALVLKQLMHARFGGTHA